MPARPFITCHRDHTPLEWRHIIAERISDPHLARWVASVIAWDYELKDEAYPLMDLADEYSAQDGEAREYGELEAALVTVGYAQAAERCKGGM